MWENKLTKLTKRAYNSPTLNTWLGFGSKVLSVTLVLPLVLRNFSTEYIALWYLFSSVISLQLLADFGFRSTFIRVIAFGMGGAKKIADLRYFKKDVDSPGPNWDIINKIYGTMFYLYIGISIVSFLLLILVGSIAFIKPINVTSDPFLGWTSWTVISIVSSITLYGRIYSNYLLGLNKVALVNRWQAIASMGSILSSFTVLMLNGNILALVISNQIWNVFRILIIKRLCYFEQNKKFAEINHDKKFNISIFHSVWPAAWRSGIASLMSNGIVQLTGVMYAQTADAKDLASYLLGLRLITTVKNFALAPFYSKLPLIATLRAESNNTSILEVARRGMFLSYVVFVVGFILIGGLGQTLFVWIGSNADFPSQTLWILLGIAFFIHRYGGMHMQLYNSTNHVISHIADGISGALFLLTSFALLQHIGVLAFPIGMLVGYLGFYSWYAAMYSYKLLSLSFVKFEMKTSFGPFVLLIIYIAFSYFLL